MTTTGSNLASANRPSGFGKTLALPGSASLPFLPDLQPPGSASGSSRGSRTAILAPGPPGSASGSRRVRRSDSVDPWSLLAVARAGVLEQASEHTTKPKKGGNLRIPGLLPVQHQDSLRASSSRSPFRPSSAISTISVIDTADVEAEPERGGAEPGWERQQSGLSHAARRENLRKERYEQVMERVRMLEPESPKGKGTHADTMSDTADCLQLLKPEEFSEDANSLTQDIEEISRGVRLDHLCEGGLSRVDEKARQAREESRKRLEAEHRLARQKEKEARDPHRKVALRLENKRRFEQEALAEAGIPMSMVDVSNAKGCKTVAVVDVVGLRRRCKMLGMDVPSMLNQKKRNEQLERNRVATPSDPPINSMLQSASCPLLTLGQNSQNYEERLERVKARNQMNHVDGIIRKLALCRNKEPYPLPFSFEVEQVPEVVAEPRAKMPQNGRRVTIVGGVGIGGMGAGAQSRQNRMRESEVAGVITEQVTASIQASPIQAKWITPGRRTSMLQKFVGDLACTMAKSDGGSKRKPNVLIRHGSKPWPFWDRMHTRPQKHWRTAWVGVQLMMLYAQVRMRAKAIHVVLDLLEELGEWVRVKFAIHRFISSIVGLQRVCRLFVHQKRRRCEVLAKEWQKVEDLYLANYFKKCSEEALKDLQKGSGQQRLRRESSLARSSISQPSAHGIVLASIQTEAERSAGRQRPRPHLTRPVLKMIEEGVKTGGLQVDWRIYRIPAEERRNVISQYYTEKVRRRARGQENFHLAVQQAVQDDKEMNRFLKHFGLDPSQQPEAFSPKAADTTKVVHVPPFWHNTDEENLMLIALAAQALLQVIPFREHPANKEISEHLRRQRLNEVRHAVLKGLRPTSQSVVLQCKYIDEDCSTLGWLRRESVQKRVKKQPVKVHVDIDEVFRRFSPRLWDISEEQAVEEQWAPDGGPALPDCGNGAAGPPHAA